MNAVAVGATFQGVICRNCGNSIRLSAAVIQRQSNQNTDLVTKVFSHDAGDAIKKASTP